MMFVAESGSGHAVVMDGAPEAGGTDLGPRPMEMLLMGMGGCASFDVVLILKRSRQEVTGCEAEVNAERADEDPKVFTKIHVHFKSMKLHGFNNLTKSLSFNIYDIAYASTAEQRADYIDYIDEVYNAERLTQILTDVSEIIGANVLDISRQDYDPQGASVTMLISEEPVISQDISTEEEPGPLPTDIAAHLDKSHITVHTYPESHPDHGTLSSWTIVYVVLRVISGVRSTISTMK
ncbi:unnamed protein product [Cyprideis torosa]|uniref:Uncharacterized protein n=1 Tax=Cyprideis torosa TaxID=163714 RepID=A0A7R8WUQ6_9CRUS|nr:unnamed protein product [Cyprideis torosa]CAG0906653.1 unnamed protein product [Cyprideis torosa]